MEWFHAHHAGLFGHHLVGYFLTYHPIVWKRKLCRPGLVLSRWAEPSFCPVSLPLFHCLSNDDRGLSLRPQPLLSWDQKKQSPVLCLKGTRQWPASLVAPACC